METLKNISSLVILGLWVYAAVHMALRWTFGDFWDFAAYSALMAVLFLVAMAGINGVYRAGTKQRNPFC